MLTIILVFAIPALFVIIINEVVNKPQPPIETPCTPDISKLVKDYFNLQAEYCINKCDDPFTPPAERYNCEVRCRRELNE